jgi:transposase-like protein
MIGSKGNQKTRKRRVCKIIKNRGSFPSDEAATKLLYLAIKNAGMLYGGESPSELSAMSRAIRNSFQRTFPGTTTITNAIIPAMGYSF